MTTLSTHVLNIATGTPAAGLEITLKRIEPHPKDLGVFTTNADGRVSDKLLSHQDALIGVYEITFHAGGYLKSLGLELPEYPFLDVIPILTASSTLMVFIYTNHLARPLLDKSHLLTTTTSIKLPKWLSVVYAHFDHHLEHHLFPALPSSRYPEVRASLEKILGREYAIPLGQAWREVLAAPIQRPIEKRVDEPTGDASAA